MDFTAERDSCIAILAVGYADGVPRNISGLGYVLCSGQKAPIIGRIYRSDAGGCYRHRYGSARW